jgi:hypothetical protein
MKIRKMFEILLVLRAEHRGGLDALCWMHFSHQIGNSYSFSCKLRTTIVAIALGDPLV